MINFVNTIYLFFSILFGLIRVNCLVPSRKEVILLRNSTIHREVPEIHGNA